jgi:transketolase
MNSAQHERAAKALSVHARREILQMTHDAGASHVGSALSVVDILCAIYSGALNISCKNYSKIDRDIVILSKGHACTALYAVLSLTGFFPEKWLREYSSNGSKLGGHVTSGYIPGVELSTGSLGHGLPYGLGISLARKRNRVSGRTYVIMSDGECDEGTTWESALIANHFGIDNLCVIIDRNNLQSMGSTESTLALEPFAEKWKAFGWDVIEIDGHNFKELVEALNYFSYKPICIIANTIKGKGVDFMEGSVVWHYRPPSKKDLLEALEQIEGSKS